ncbi:hypothetical protein DH2020_032048 [Rehmannia glutinosa]|uniref:F-box domain-containing protein n=1 Tax=Rehmannia glutinosa TaxID=99300 RepID=A0ABR0VGE9_REHGL
MAADWLKFLNQPRSIETERDWSESPREILSLILSNLFFKDRRSFKLVCKSWNSIIPNTPLLPPAIDSQYFDSPCLIFSQRSSDCWKLFHSVYNGYYYLEFPELKDAEIHFSKDGWLLMSRDKSNLFFFSPFTKEKLQLPPTTDPFYSVCFTSTPTSPDCSVFGILGKSTRGRVNLGHIKIGDEEWELETFDNGAHYFWFSECPPVFCNGVYYCFDFNSRNFRVFDPRKDDDEHRWITCGECLETSEDEDNEDEGDEEDEDDEEENDDDEEDDENEEDDEELTETEEDEEEKEDEDEEEVKENEEDDYEEEEDDEDDDYDNGILYESYFAEVEGDIWGVFVTNHDRGFISVEKWDFAKMCWKKLDDLGDKCLYVSPSGTFAETCGVSGMANKIYFNKFHGKNGVMYSLTTRKYHSIEGNFASKNAFGLTEMDHGTWIKPTLHKM